MAVNDTPNDIEPRKGSPSPRLGEAEFKKRFLNQFQDHAFNPLHTELAKVTAAAWDAYENSRKSPHTRKAGRSLRTPRTISPQIGLLRVTQSPMPKISTRIRIVRSGYC